jgi:hydrogenase nickel incorporation protein HypB
MNSDMERTIKPKNSYDPGSPNRDEDRKVHVITLEENILEENDRIASRNRAYLQSKGIISLNLMSSPGSGKTTLLVETLKQLKDEIPCGVIEGDQQTSNDAQRIAATDVPVVQINTRQSCHLDAFHVQKAFHELPLDKIQILFIENVGNLICPAAFDLGEAEKIAIMSITEGEDKPIKYPLTFHLASLLVLTKMDLLPHLQFDVDLCKQYARQVNPGLRIIETSSYTHQGFTDWFEYLRGMV